MSKFCYDFLQHACDYGDDFVHKKQISYVSGCSDLTFWKSIVESFIELLSFKAKLGTLRNSRYEFVDLFLHTDGRH